MEAIENRWRPFQPHWQNRKGRTPAPPAVPESKLVLPLPIREETLMASRCISDSHTASDGLRMWLRRPPRRHQDTAKLLGLLRTALRRSMPCEANVYQNQYAIPTTKMLPTVRNRISGATLMILDTALFTVVWSSARVGRRALVGESFRD